MKKILFLLFLLPLLSQAQFPNTITSGNSSTLQKANGAFGGMLGYVFAGSYGDTIAANLSFIKNVPGIVIRNIDTLWQRNNTATKWIKIGAGSIPNLQQVTDVGSITTNGITAPSFGDQTGLFLLTTTGVGDLQLSSGTGVDHLMPQAVSTGNNFRLPNTGHLTDTLATLSDVRNGSGGGENVGDSIYYLSEEGAISDADLRYGSTVFGTDNTAVIQAVLNKASPQHGILVYVDGRYSVTGLVIKGNTSLIATDNSNGLILRDSSNKPLIRNYNKSFDPSARLDSNITIRGGIYNGNGVGQSNIGNSTYGLNSIFQFSGVYELRIENFILRDPRSYAIDARNNRYYYVLNGEIRNSSYANNDGVHADGNSEDFVFENLYLQDGNDDKIALNADDNYIYATGHATYPYYVGSEGYVKNGLIKNITFLGGNYGIRILSDSSRVDNILFENITGTTGSKWLETDRAGLAGAGDIGKITFKDINIDVTHLVTSYEANIATKIETLILQNVNRVNFDTDSIATVLFNTGADVKNVIVDGYTATDTTSNPTNHFVFTGGIVGSFSISNSTIRKTAQTDSSNLILVNGATVQRLRLSNVEVDSLESVVRYTNGQLPYISAVGITHFAADSSQTFYAASGKTIYDLVLSNYFGYQPTGGSGTFSRVRGDGFLDLPNRPVEPPSDWSDLVFTHFVNGPLDNTSGVWTSGGTVDNAYNHKGTNDLAFAAGGNGGLQMYADAAADGCRIGFNADGAWPTTPYIWTGFEFLGGSVIAHNGLSGTSVVEAVSTGYYYRIIKTGDSFVLKKSATENGTYSTIYTYSSTWSSTMWPMCDIAGNPSIYKLYYPKYTGAE